MTLDSVETEPVDHGAWMAPGVYPVAEGVWRIPLPLPMTDLSCVNAWVMKDGDDVVLIDPGWATGESEGVLKDALSGLDIAFGEVRQVIATHTHWDHYSEAMVLRQRFGTPVLIGEGERFTVEAYREGGAFFSEQSERLLACGASLLARTVATLEPEPYEIGITFGAPSGWLAHGQRISLGDSEIIVHATPGHTRGHVVIAKRDAGILFTGDHVLPRITPSIGLELRPEAFPLRSFLSSLAFVKSLPDAAVLPAHGNVTPSVHLRADELLAHHESRFDAVTRQLRGETETAMGIASRMKWTRHERELTELAPVHQMAAVLEIAAHLDVLDQRGRVTRKTVDEIDYFAAA